MKPREAWNELDLAVAEVVRGLGCEFAGAEFPQPIDDTPRAFVHFAWHALIDGKHAIATINVSPEMLADDEWSTPYIVATITDRLAGLAAR